MRMEKSTAEAPRPHAVWWVIAFLVGTGLCIAAVALWTARLQSQAYQIEIQEQLIRQVVSAAGSVDPHLAQHLTFTEADAQTPIFQVIRERLLEASRNLKCRGIYTLALRDGQLVFGPETYPKDDPQASPAGTVYQQPPQALWDIFRQKQPKVIGPYTDEYGSFVSAFAPVILPETDQVVLVVGMDLEADDWQTMVRASVANTWLLAGFALIWVLGSGLLVLWVRRIASQSPIQLRRWIVGPVAVGIACWFAYWAVWKNDTHSDPAEQSFHRLLLQTHREWQRLLQSKAQMLRSLFQDLAENEEICKAWHHRDRNTLWYLVPPLAQQMKARYRITHFYFIEPDGTCFFRGHTPEKYGDRITRTSFQTAAQTGKDCWGIELGKQGTFTLRYVRPWKYQGQPDGYIELGLELESLAQEVARNVGVEVVALFRKAYLPEGAFQRGKQLFGYVGDWETYPDLVIGHQTLAELPPQLHQRLAASSKAFSQRWEAISWNGRTWQAGCVPLRDIGGRQVADLIVLNDITPQANWHRSLSWFSLGVGAAFCLGILALLGTVTHIAEGQLRKAFHELNTQRQWLHATLHSIGDGVISTDPEGRIVDMNPPAQQMTGWSADEALGKPIREVFRIVQASTGQAVADPVEKVLQTGQMVALSNDTTLISRDGIHRQIADTCAPIREGQGPLLGTVLVFHDVSKEYELKRALRQRVKEMHCLLQIRDLLDGQWEEEAICRQAAARLAEALQWPELAQTYIELAGRWYPGDPNMPSDVPPRLPQNPKHLLQADIQVHRQPVGRVVVFYREPRPFLIPYEQDLVQMAARLLGHYFDHQQAQQAIQTEREKLQAVFEASPVGLLLFDPHGDILQVNQTAAEYLGIDPQRPCRTQPGNLFGCIHSKETTQGCGHSSFCPQCPVRQTLERALLTHQPQEVEETRLELEQEGQIRPVWVHWAVQPIRLAGDWYAVAAFQDITARKSAEQELQHALDLAVRHQAETAALLDAAKAVLQHRQFKDAAERIFHIAKQQLGAAAGYIALLKESGNQAELVFMDTGGQECRVQKDLPLLMRGIHKLAYESRVPVWENHFAESPWAELLPPGHVSVHNVMVVPLIVEEKVLGLLALGNKSAEWTTEDARIASALADLAAIALWNSQNLDSLVQSKKEVERYAEALETTNRVLKEFVHLAESAARAKSEFLTNISHEIRTPMTAILGYTELLLDELAGSPLGEYLQTIQRNGQYLLQLLDDILDLSKIEVGKLSVYWSWCSPQEIAAEVQQLLQVRAETKGIQLTVQAAPNAPERILTDPVRLRQILVNLVGNAIKFTEVGSVQILVQSASDSAQVQFDIIDTGIGMSAEQTAKIFQPFSQADSSVTRKYGGTGLELAISKRLAELLGGQLTLVRTTVGVGSHFRLTLPIHPPQQENAPTSTPSLPTQASHGAPSLQTAGLENPSPDPLETSSSQPVDFEEVPATLISETRPAPLTTILQGVRILLAEDAPENQRLLTLILQKGGAEVTVVDNGQLAVQTALAAQREGKPFDVILMDMQMPVMDGYSATQQLRSEGYTGPILALTAHAMTEDREKCIQAGCNDYLSKPVSRTVLLRMTAQYACCSRLPFPPAPRPLLSDTGSPGSP